MKDIETLLKQNGSAKPKRALRPNFTNDITNYLAEHPRLSLAARLKETKIMKLKLFTKPAIAVFALALLVITGGGVYAAVGGWPGIQSIFSGQKILQSGDRVVKVDTKNCSYISPFTIGQQNKQVDSVYYRVKASSKLSNDQVVQLVLGNCFAEEQAKFDQRVVNDILFANPLNKDRVIGGYADSLVTAITSSSITIKSVMPVNQQLETFEQTFSNIAPDVLVYQSPNKLTWNDIKVGDRVSIKYRASGEALTKSETMPLSQVKPEEQVLVMVNKNTPEYSTAISYQKYNGSEFEEVTPCGNADGYCNYEQFVSKQ